MSEVIVIPREQPVEQQPVKVKTKEEIMAKLALKFTDSRAKKETVK